MRRKLSDEQAERTLVRYDERAAEQVVVQILDNKLLAAKYTFERI